MAFVHFNMPSSEFIEHLRAGAIKARLAPQVVDQIDGLHDILDLESEMEKVQTESREMEEARDAAVNELYDLLAYIPRILDPETRDTITALELNTVLRRALDEVSRADIYQDDSVAKLKELLGIKP